MYIGKKVQKEGQTEKEVNRRLAITKRAITELNSLIWSRDISIKTKKIIYNIIIESILLYEAETSTISKANEKKFLTPEKNFRR